MNDAGPGLFNFILIVQNFYLIPYLDKLVSLFL